MSTPDNPALAAALRLADAMALPKSINAEDAWITARECANQYRNPGETIFEATIRLLAARVRELEQYHAETVRLRTTQPAACDVCLGEGELRSWDGDGELDVRPCARCNGTGAAVRALEQQLAEAQYHAETVRLIENEHCGSVSIHPGEDILVMAHKLTSRDKVTYVRARLHTLGEAVRDCVRQLETSSTSNVPVNNLPTPK